MIDEKKYKKNSDLMADTFFCVHIIRSWSWTMRKFIKEVRKLFRYIIENVKKPYMQQAKTITNQ